METNRLYQLMAAYLEERISAGEKEELRLGLQNPAMQEAAESLINYQLASGLFTTDTGEADLAELEARIAQLVAARGKQKPATILPLRRL